ncbi:MAG: N-acetylmuramoyl-L-alanine amidase [Stomatobaculum sp.]|nr:N-acetylmuramoyl-L-alanine amidase [Stomatobaculum sp.]
MKKRAIAAAAAAAAMILAAQAVFASQTMYVKGDAVNIRTAPSTGSEVKGQVFRGDSVTVLETNDGWAKTENGYIKADFLTDSQPAAPASTGNSGASSGGAAQTSAEVPEGVTVETVRLTGDLRFSDFSKINSGSAILYRNTNGSHGDIVVCVNAGHGTKGGGSVKTLSHPDGTGKVTGGSNPNGAVWSTAVSSGMEFADGTEEHVITLREAKALRAKLLDRGYSVLMIREESDVQLDNIARTVLANNYADCHVAIHWDSSTSDKGAFYMSVPDGLKYLDPVSSTWQKSEAFGEALIAGLRGRGVKIFSGGSMDMDLTQTSYSSIASVDIELGDKVSDHSAAALDNIAEGLADGIEQYFAR